MFIVTSINISYIIICVGCSLFFFLFSLFIVQIIFNVSRGYRTRTLIYDFFHISKVQSRDYYYRFYNYLFTCALEARLGRLRNYVIAQPMQVTIFFLFSFYIYRISFYLPVTILISWSTINSMFFRKYFFFFKSLFYNG